MFALVLKPLVGERMLRNSISMNETREIARTLGSPPRWTHTEILIPVGHDHQIWLDDSKITH
jgi:hypothetical protein